MLIFDDKDKFDVGTPNVSRASVKVKVLEPEHKADKVIIVKYKPKKRYRRKTGHRQKYTRVEVEKITT